MVNITLFELHFDNATFSSSALFGGDGESTDENESGDTDEATTAEESGVPVKAVAALAALGTVVGVVLAVKRLRGGDEPEVEIETRDEHEGDNRPVGIAVDE